MSNALTNNLEIIRQLKIHLTDLLLKDSIEGAISLDCDGLPLSDSLDVDWFLRVETETFSQLLHFVVKIVYLNFTSVDVLCQVFYVSVQTEFKNNS